MLDLHEISLLVGQPPQEQTLLHEVSAKLPQKHFCAIVGPSGCGKSTLLKVIAGIREQSLGTIRWEGRDLAHEGDLDPHEVGYVPQFSIAYDYLTVWESVETALRLRVRGLDADARRARTEKLLTEVGLIDISDRLVKVLSGGQKRRLPMAMEMVSSPSLLLVDEVTSGLDPKSEDEIVRLMKTLSEEDNRIVISITHSLRHLALYDSIIVLYQGHLAYHGPPKYLCHYFGVEGTEDLFPALAKRTGTDWHRSWMKHHSAYDSMLHKETPSEAAAKTVEETPSQRMERLFSDLPKQPAAEESKAGEKDEGRDERAAKTETQPGGSTGDKAASEREREDVTPGALSQLATLLGRRWKIFLRDKSAMVLQLALMFGFPCLVVIFALDGLPQMKHVTMGAQTNIIQQMKENADVMRQALQVGGLVSGLVMLQVILLTLIGSNNSAREIAAERLVFEKEKFGGVRPLSYVLSKAGFLAVLVIAQSVWMAVFVNVICRLPGDLVTQIALLVMVNGAMTAICLGLSALMKTPEQASLVSYYLVGFQLPLSGAVLALPKALALMTRPFIAAYWSWSGFLQTMKVTPFYDAVMKVTQTPLSDLSLCFLVLGAHVVIGVFLAYMGCKTSRWE
jgi:ABC transport system ATP-binding/permease protein